MSDRTSAAVFLDRDGRDRGYRSRDDQLEILPPLARERKAWRGPASSFERRRSCHITPLPISDSRLTALSEICSDRKVEA
jgi:hypothetical protein